MGGATQRWYRGYRLALIEAGFPPSPTLTQSLDSRRDAVESVVEAMLDGPDAPTALVISNPDLAQSVVGWFHRSGRQVPIHTLEVKEMQRSAIRELPAVIISVERLAEYALRRLLDLSYRHPDLPLVTHVPFELRGMERP